MIIKLPKFKDLRWKLAIFEKVNHDVYHLQMGHGFYNYVKQKVLICGPHPASLVASYGIQDFHRIMGYLLGDLL